MTTVDSMAEEITQLFQEYKDLAASEMKEAVKIAADKAKEDIKQSAPKQTGEYSKSWAVKKISEKSNSVELCVYSKNRYQLTHLLEFGHALRNGGRSAAIPHIEPAQTDADNVLEKELKRRLEAIQ